MANLPHVTVIVPCFNRQDSVARSIESVLTQDYPSFDVIAVDDASTDYTMLRLTQIHDDRLTVVRNLGMKGVSSARNLGVSQATGDWIAFQDSDDIWLKDKLKTQMESLKEDDVAVYCAMDIVKSFGQGDQIIGRVPPSIPFPRAGNVIPGLLWESLVSTQTLVLSRKVFDLVGGFDESLSALVDWDLMIRVAQKGQVAFADKVLVKQHFSPNSITNSGEKRLFAQEVILDKNQALFKSFPRVHARHLNKLAGGYRRFGDIERSLEYLSLAISAHPTNVRYRLAALLTRLGAPGFRRRSNQL